MLGGVTRCGAVRVSAAGFAASSAAGAFRVWAIGAALSGAEGANSITAPATAAATMPTTMPQTTAAARTLPPEPRFSDMGDTLGHPRRRGHGTYAARVTDRRSLRTVLAIAAAGLLGACTSTTAGQTDGVVDRAARPEVSIVERYVALGDSYTAAPLVAGKSSNDGCFRSSNNYPSQLAAELEVATFVDRSCSGAVSADMTRRQQTAFGGSRPPQFRALSADTDLVTVGIGGNDFGLFSNLTGRCPTLRASDPAGSPCRDAFASGDGNDLTRDASRIRARVSRAIRGIQARSPEARIVVVDYPRIVPHRGTCPARLPLATGDYPWAARVNARLSSSVRRAAEGAGVDYLDLFGASAGHDICADDPWVNGRRTEAGTALAYHPLAEQQRAVADLVLALLETPNP